MPSFRGPSPSGPRVVLLATGWVACVGLTRGGVAEAAGADGAALGTRVGAELAGAIPPTGAAAPPTCSGAFPQAVTRASPAVMTATIAIVVRRISFPLSQKRSVSLSYGAMRRSRPWFWDLCNGWVTTR